MVVTRLECSGLPHTASLRWLGLTRFVRSIKRGFGTQRARLGTFRCFGTERARLDTLRGFGTERARVGTFKKISKMCVFFFFF